MRPARPFDEEPTGFFEPGLALAPTAAYAGTTDCSIGTGPNPDTAVYNYPGAEMWGPSEPYGFLISFDLTSIPSWATISSASLNLQVTSGGPGTYPAVDVTYTCTGGRWRRS